MQAEQYYTDAPHPYRKAAVSSNNNDLLHSQLSARHGTAIAFVYKLT